MTYPRSPRGAASVTAPLEDLALSDKESVFHIPRAGDVALLGVLVAVLLGNGVWLWRQLGADSHAGRAIFFGMALACVYWCAVVYTFKLSLSVCVSPRSISVVRGPLRVEIRWADLSRLMERIQTLDGRRYRWVIALARDGRRISVREDAIGDYARFRREAYERYRNYRDHGGTWGATGSGPFVAKETIRDEAQWWCIAALMIALPGAYFMVLLPETNPLGYAMLAGAALCLIMLLRAALARQTYTVDRGYVQTRRALSRARLPWNNISKVERVRHPISGVILTGVAAGRIVLRLMSRTDMGIRHFTWSPRVPEYLVLRGGGRHARIRLHRLMQPDELLAWIEFYDQLRHTRTSGGPRPHPAAAPMSGPLAAEAAPANAPDLSGVSGPLDPWGAGRRGEPSAPTAPTHAAPAANGGFTRATSGARPASGFDTFDHTELPTVQTPAAEQSDDAWLRETGAMPNVGHNGGVHQPTPRPAAQAGREAGRDASPWESYVVDHMSTTDVRPSAPPMGSPQSAPWMTPPPASPERAPHSGGWQDLSRPQKVVDALPANDTPLTPPPHAQTVEANPTHWADAWRDEQQPQPQPQPRQPEWRDHADLRAPSQPAHEPAHEPAYEQPAFAPQQPHSAEPVAEFTAGDDIDVEPEAYGEDAPTAEATEAPWRDEGWQPPVLPRFGPQNNEPQR